METSHTKVSLAVGTWLGLVGLTMVVSGSMLFIHLATQKPQVVQQQRGTIGDISKMSAEDLKEAYGPVNQDKMKEVKDGIFRNIANRRRAAICAPQQPQVCYSQVQSYCGTYYTPAPSYTPSYAVPVAVPQVVVPTPAYNPPNPLKIQPSCDGPGCQAAQEGAPKINDTPVVKQHPPALKIEDEDMTYQPGQPWKFKASI